MLFHQFRLLIFIALWVITSSSQTLCQSLHKDILQKRISITLTNVDLLVALKTLSRENQISIGVEYSESTTGSNQLNEHITFNTSQLPLKSVLRKLVEAEPQFIWHVTNDVINVMPRKSSNSPLDTKVSSFKVEDMTKNDITDTIYDLPEFRQALELAGLSPGFIIIVKPLQEDKTKISISLTNTTVRDILNEIAKKTNNKFWSTSIFQKHLFVNL